jgi:predicted nuclease of predicted toxin-antitoxin system
MARLYTNENIPLPVVEALRQRGHDVLTTYESGKANQAIPDSEVLAFATEQGRVLITFNRKHFIRLHAESADHAGIVVCTVDVDFEALAQRIHAALEAHEALSGQLLRINKPPEKQP